MRVIVAGATGFLGRAVVRALSGRGDDVVVLTRHTAGASVQSLAKLPGVVPLAWTGTEQQEPWWDEVPRADAILNFSGEPIIEERWSATRKQVLRDSRVNSTRAIVRALQAATPRPRVFINGSAIGFYGPHGDEQLAEDAPGGTGFLATICKDWEAAAQEVDGSRLVILRIGVVFGHGGALSQMVTPFRYFVGGPLGSGTQWVSWIHIADLVGLTLFSIDSPFLSGPVNATAPGPVTNRQLSTLLGKILHRPSGIPTPAFIVRLALGEASETVLTGQRVLPTKAIAAGYSFRHPRCDEALLSLFG
jgi:uncharacterized protein (TIGR01777 family)